MNRLGEPKFNFYIEQFLVMKSLSHGRTSDYQNLFPM